MKVSLYCSGQTIAELQRDLAGDARRLEADARVAVDQRAAIARHPSRQAVSHLQLVLSSFGASTPAANRHFSESLSCW